MNYRVTNEKDELRKVVHKGETVIDIEEVRKSLNETNGNPQIISVLQELVNLIEKEM